MPAYIHTHSAHFVAHHSDDDLIVSLNIPSEKYGIYPEPAKQEKFPISMQSIVGTSTMYKQGAQQTHLNKKKVPK